MKFRNRIFLMTLIIISALAFTACSTDNNEKGTDQEVETQDKKQEDKIENVEMKEAGEKSMMTIKGQASVEAKPSIAYLNIGVVSKSDNIKTAQDENNKNIDQLRKILIENGIEEGDISTSSFYIDTNYDQETYTKIVGYTVNHNLNIKVNDIDRAGEIMDLATKNGANRSNNIRFGISDQEREDLYQEALAKAAEKAGIKASRLAESMGIKIRGPVEVIEGSKNYLPGMESEYGLYMDLEGQAKMDTSFNPGDISINATVTLVYVY
ncbi:MAG: SIMPL domain-containing protein [Tissierellia bacterium]|nr:SIMPL domain-containing protein [Tissierellia bacterium]